MINSLERQEASRCVYTHVAWWCFCFAIAHIMWMSWSASCPAWPALTVASPFTNTVQPCELLIPRSPASRTSSVPRRKARPHSRPVSCPEPTNARRLALELARSNALDAPAKPRCCGRHTHTMPDGHDLLCAPQTHTVQWHRAPWLIRTSTVPHCHCVRSVKHTAPATPTQGQRMRVHHRNVHFPDHQGLAPKEPRPDAALCVTVAPRPCVRRPWSWRAVCANDAA